MGDYTLHTRPGGLGSGATGLAATQELANRHNMRFERGISRIGKLEVDVIALAGASAPAPGDYVEVRYSGGNPPWSGVVREVAQAKDDTDKYHVTAFDALGEVDRRNVNQRRSFTSTDERTIITTILGDLGITTTSEPIRYSTNSILAGGTGNAVDSYRSEYDDGLAALRQLAVTYGREIFWQRESNGSGGHVWVLYYLNRVPDATKSSAVQATFRAGVELDKLTDVTDDYEKATGVRVLGQGDGTAAANQTAGTTGGANPTFVVPAKGVRSSTVASSLATTLQNTFGANRRVLVAPTGYAEPLTDGAVDLGYLVTLQDEAGSGLGNFRVMHVEVDEDYKDGWFSRLTFISGSIAALPSVSGPAGVRPPGITDLQQNDLEHKLATQNPHDSSSTRQGATAVNNSQPAATGPTNKADGASLSVTLNFTARSFVVATDEAIVFMMQVFSLDPGTTNGLQGTFDIELQLAGTPIFRGRYGTDQGSAGNSAKWEFPLYVPAAFVANVIGLGGTLTSAVLQATNRSGAARDVSVQLSADVVGQHFHASA